MKKHEYPGLAAHQELHALFLDKLDGLTGEYDVYRAPTQWMADQILELTQGWLLAHITDEDTHYAEHVRAQS